MTTIARIVLVLMIAGMTVIVVQPQYNFAHWVPRDLLELFGVHYAAQLWLEQHMDAFLHFFGAGILTLLTIMAFPNFDFHRHRFGVTAILLTVFIGAEFIQSLIGRGFSITDLGLGLFGVCTSLWLYWVKTTDRNN